MRAHRGQQRVRRAATAVARLVEEHRAAVETYRSATGDDDLVAADLRVDRAQRARYALDRVWMPS